MLQKYQKGMNMLFGSGVPLYIVGQFILPHIQGIPAIVTPTCVLVGYFLILFGCRLFAMAKGYSGTKGLLAGLLSILGLLILLLMKDKNK